MQVAITGNTYPVKDALKALGAKWDGDNKCWTISDKKAEQARKLVSNAPVAKTTPGVCLKCKGPVKAPYTICYDCKNGISSNRTSGSSNRCSTWCEECGERATPGTRCWETGCSH